MVRRFAGLVLFVGLLEAMVGQELPALKRVPPPPEQPIAFNHRLHVSNGLKCLDCHPIPDPGDFAEIVEAAKCMSCHQSIKTDSAAIQKLAAYFKDEQPVPWEPVYLVPDYVFFSHRVHTGKVGAKCVACHGPVEEREVLSKERDISMAACMECHRVAGGALECNYCHEPR